MAKPLSKKEIRRRQMIRFSPWVKKEISHLNPARIFTLDLETTGLSLDAEILQLSIVNGRGKVLVNRYFKPIYTERWDDAMAVNHISPKKVKDKDPFLLWADSISNLLQRAELIIGYGIYNDLHWLHTSGVILPDKPLYLDLAEAFSLVHYGPQHKQITYAALKDCAAYYGYPAENWHNSLADTQATFFCFQQMLRDDQAIFARHRYTLT